jgi:signal transduction histidine kinase
MALRDSSTRTDGLGKEQEGFLGQVIERMPGAFWLVSEDLRLVWCDSKATSLTGQGTVGRNFHEVFSEVANPEKLDRLLLHGERVTFRPNPAAPLFDWFLAGEPLPDGSRLLMSWDSDLTDEMQQRRTEFMIGASHELRSPLTALVGFAEILDMHREGLTPTQEEAVCTILRNAKHLTGLVDDVLDLTRNSFGELPLALENVNVGDLVREAADSLDPSIAEKGQTLSVCIEEGIPELEADPTRLTQVVMNLIQNANTHCPEGTSVEVSVRRRDAGVEIAVADDGPGLPFEDPDEAFSSFRRGEPLDGQEAEGSGIGLTMARRLTELHRGQITAETVAGGGTTFRVWLPEDRAGTFTRVPPGPA